MAALEQSVSLITQHFHFRAITCEPQELRHWENFLGRTNLSGGKKLYLSLSVIPTEWKLKLEKNER